MEATEKEPITRIPFRIVFNRLNGDHIFNVSKTPFDPVYDESLFIVREADMNPMDDEVIGKIIVNPNGTLVDDWQVVNRNDLPEMVTEKALNVIAEQKITKKYPLVSQINILSRAIKQLGDKAGIELEELDEMLSYIQLTLSTNKAQKAFYSETDSIRYYSDEELADKEIRKMEGGVHEFFGPRAATGGRVFSTDG